MKNAFYFILKVFFRSQDIYMEPVTYLIFVASEFILLNSFYLGHVKCRVTVEGTFFLWSIFVLESWENSWKIFFHFSKGFKVLTWKYNLLL